MGKTSYRTAEELTFELTLIISELAKDILSKTAMTFCHSLAENQQVVQESAYARSALGLYARSRLLGR